MVGHYLDPLPAGIEQLTDSTHDAVNIVVEIVDKPDADVVATVVQLASFRPSHTRRIASIGGAKDLHTSICHKRPQHLDRCLRSCRCVCWTQTWTRGQQVGCHRY